MDLSGVEAAVIFGRTRLYFGVWQVWRSMPLLVGLVLVALFIWFAENVGTFPGGWIYPHQAHGWTPVGIGKLGAWFLLMLISYVLVCVVNRPRPLPTQRLSETRVFM